MREGLQRFSTHKDCQLNDKFDLQKVLQAELLGFKPEDLRAVADQSIRGTPCIWQKAAACFLRASLHTASFSLSCDSDTLQLPTALHFLRFKSFARGDVYN